MSSPQVPDTWHQGAGKKSWCRVRQFLHVDALCRLCSCVIAFAKRVRHTTRAMEVLPADFAWVVCEVWRAWRVIGDSFAAAGCCAGHGVSAARCDRSAAAVCGTFQRFDLRENCQNKTNSLLNRFWSYQARLTLLYRYFLFFLLNRSHCCTLL